MCVCVCERDTVSGPLKSLQINICLCRTAPGQVLESQGLTSFKRQHNVFWIRVMNCDTREGLAGEEVPSTLPYYTY